MCGISSFLSLLLLASSLMFHCGAVNNEDSAAFRADPSADKVTQTTTMHLFFLLRAGSNSVTVTPAQLQASLSTRQYFLSQIPGAPTSLEHCSEEQQTKIAAFVGLATMFTGGGPQQGLLILKLLTSVASSSFFSAFSEFLAHPPMFSARAARPARPVDSATPSSASSLETQNQTTSTTSASDSQHANTKSKDESEEMGWEQRAVPAEEAFDFVAFNVLFLFSSALGPASSKSVLFSATKVLTPVGFFELPIDTLLVFARREHTANILRVSAATQRLALLALDRLSKCDVTRTALHATGRLDRVLATLTLSRDTVRATQKQLAQPVGRETIHTLSTGTDGSVTLEPSHAHSVDWSKKNATEIHSL